MTSLPKSVAGAQRRRTVWLGSHCLAGMLCGCTLLTNFDVDQCSTDADCNLIGGTASHCADSRCVSGCLRNADCAALDPRAPICRETGGSCVSLSTEGGECYSSTDYVESSMADRTAANMVLLGSFQPYVEPSTWLTAELAVNELNDAGGLPVAGSSSPVMLVWCDDAPNALPTAMQHLVQNIGVRGVVAPAGTKALQDAMTLPATSGQAFLLSPTDSYAPPEDFAGSAPLLWYLGADYRSTIKAYVELFRRLQSSRAPTALRVAFVEDHSVEATRLADAVGAALELDGMGENELAVHDRLRRYALTPLAADQEWLLELGNYAPELLAFFVADADVGSGAPGLSAFLDQLGALEASATWAPLYVFGPQNAKNSSLSTRALVDPTFTDRALGVRPYRSEPAAVLDSLRTRFVSAFPAASSQPSPALYDAIYLLAYAVAAAPQAAPGGKRLSLGFERITAAASEQVPVGPGDAGLTRVRQLLEAGANFQLLGTTGPADFDSVQHVRPSSAQVYCWRDGAARELATYDDSTQTFLLGSADCARGAL